jgi:hypothetical protein
VRVGVGTCGMESGGRLMQDSSILEGGVVALRNFR